jgi:hypothetical protein
MDVMADILVRDLFPEHRREVLDFVAYLLPERARPLPANPGRGRFADTGVRSPQSVDVSTVIYRYQVYRFLSFVGEEYQPVAFCNPGCFLPVQCT